MSRINVLVKGNKVFIGTLPREEGGFYIHGVDHWLVYNRNLNFIDWFPPNSELYYEILKSPKLCRRFYTELNNYHFAYLKDYRRAYIDEVIKDGFSLDKVKKISPPVGTKINLEMLDEEKILEIYDSFNFKGTTKP